MPPLSAAIDPEVLEDLKAAAQVCTFLEAVGQAVELWETLALVNGHRGLVLQQVKKLTMMGGSSRAAIALPLTERITEIRGKFRPTVQQLRLFMDRIPGTMADPARAEFLVGFIMASAKGREAVTRWIIEPEHHVSSATEKFSVMSGLVDAYRAALEPWHPPLPAIRPVHLNEFPEEVAESEEPPPPVEPAAGAAPAVEAPPEPPPEPPPRRTLAPSPSTEDRSGPVTTFYPPRPRVAPPPPPPEPAAPEAPAPEAPRPAVELPPGVDAEILEDVRRVEQCRRIFEETHQQIEVWEVFMLVMTDRATTKARVDELLRLKETGEKELFVEGALSLFEQLLKVRAEYGKLVRPLREYLASLPVGSFGRETMEMALGFIVASARGREAAKMWLDEPMRYKMMASGRLEDIISRTINYQTALRMPA